jgi:flotillin
MFFRRITALPCESLLIIRRRKLVNLGNGASCILFPGDSYALVPTTTVEHTWQMHQESWDGIKLRFRGIVIYRIVDVERAASLFAFTQSSGVDYISAAIGDICMGELRAIAAQMTMDQCIKERKTTISDRLQESVIPLIEGTNENNGWGMKIDVLQVAQVFCPDEQLLSQLQADARDKIRKTAQLSQIETNNDIEKTRIDSDIEMTARSLELDKAKLEKMREYEKKKSEIDNQVKLTALESKREFEQRKRTIDSEVELSALESKKIVEEKRIITESELRAFELEKSLENAEKELRLKEIEARIKEIEVKSHSLEEKAMMEIKRELLPLEQLPKISENFTGMFKDSKLTFIGDQNHLFNSVSQMLSMFMDTMKNGHRKEETLAGN